MDNEQSDVNDPATGFLWDNLQKNGVSYRIYGEFVTASWCEPEKVASPKQGTPSKLRRTRAQINKSEPLPANVGQPHGSPSPFPWPIPVLHSVRPNKAALRHHFDPLYPDFNTDYPDQLRADEFLNEFGAFVRALEEGKGPTLPSFVLLYLPDDHTGGTRPGQADSKMHPLPTTISLWDASRRRSLTVRTGTTQRSWSLKMMHKTVPITWMLIAPLRW